MSSMRNARYLVLLAATLIALCVSSLPVFAQQQTTIGVSLAQDDNPFYIAMLKGIRERAQELSWDVVTVSANEDKAKQIAGVQDLIARGDKGVIITPIGGVGVNEGKGDVKPENIPIVLVARGS